MGEKKKTFLLKSRRRQECPFSLLLFNTTLSLARAIRQETEIKGIQVGKEDMTLSLFADDIILYRENPKDSTKKTVEINKFSEISGCKINV